MKALLCLFCNYVRKLDRFSTGPARWKRHAHRALYCLNGIDRTPLPFKPNPLGLFMRDTLCRQTIDDRSLQLEGRTLRPIVSFLLGTGARRGEALALRWKDIDFEKGVVSIERSLEQTKAGLRIKAPKTKDGRRKISISPWVVAELRAHRARQQERRLSLGQGRAPEDSLVFARWDGATRAPHWLTQKFALAMVALKIDCTLHGLRHTHVSQLIAAGLDVLTISRRIGRASAAITLSVYGHMFGNTDARAAEIMEATFSKVRTE